MAGASVAARMLGLVGEGDVSQDEAARRKREAQKAASGTPGGPLAGLTDFLSTYSNAAQSLLGADKRPAAQQGMGDMIADIQSAAAADPTRIRKARK